MNYLATNLDAWRQALLVLYRNKYLVLEMAKREISDRYAGQAFGMFWAIGHPAFLIGLYVFVFAFVFKQKIGGTVEMPLDYTAYLLSGLVAWLAFQESMTKSCTAITSNAALVKQVVFPLEVLPVKGVLASLFPQLVSFVVLILYVLFTHGTVHVTYFLLPILLAMQIMAMIGLAYILSAIGAYFRDIKDFVQLFAVAGIYLMPVFYLPGWVPSLFRPLLYLNPFSYLVWCYQDVLYYGRFEHPWAWVFTCLMSPMIFVFGYRVFCKLKPGFGNLL